MIHAPTGRLSVRARELLFALALALVCCTGLATERPSAQQLPREVRKDGAASPQQRALRPNVVLVILDQLRADMLGCYGNTSCKTPNIDALAAKGTIFTRAYVPYSQCSPARASLMTGLEPHRTGIRIQPLAHQAAEERLRFDLPSLGSACKAAGYATAYFGKWHLSPPASEEQELARYGYDLFVKGPPAPREIEAFREQGQEHLYFDGPLAGTCTKTGSWTEVLAGEALRFIERHRAEDPQQPFLLVYSDPRPHPPYVVPPDVLERYAPKDVPLWPNLRDDLALRSELVQRMRTNMVGAPPPADDFWRGVLRHYAAMLSAADEQIGRLLASLQKHGIERDTIVVFVADHGDTLGAHGFFSKSAVPFEELIRIPLLIRWPGQVLEGATSAALIGIQDVFPTLIELAGLGVETEGMSGASLAPLLRGEKPAAWRQYYHSWHEGNVYGKLTMDVLVGQRFKYVFYPLGGSELYDREQDPWELKNLAGEEAHRGTAQEMHAFLLQKIQQDKYRSYAMPQSPR